MIQPQQRLESIIPSRMLAARDQENLVHRHQQAAASKPQNQNNRVLPPKTPLTTSLHDENETAGFGGGKSALNTKGKGQENLVTGTKKGAIFDKNAFITPIGPRNRAPLGMKTTNAKAKVFQTPAEPIVDKDLQKTQVKPTTTRRPKPKLLPTETIKLNVLGDDDDPLEERDVEYCPPKPKDLSYESDVFPDGCLDYDILKQPNLMRGWQSYYFDRVDENGVSLKEKEFEESCAKALKDADEKIIKAVEEQEWTVGDVPETFSNMRQSSSGTQDFEQTKESGKSSRLVGKGPATITSKKAASALSALPKNVATAKTVKVTPASRKPISLLPRSRNVTSSAPVNPLAMRYTAATAISRNTIGYKKGRSASSALNMHDGGLPRAMSNLSIASDTTITPASYAHRQGPEARADEWKQIKFWGVFDTDDDLEPGLRGIQPDCLRKLDEDEEEFVMTLPGL